MRIVVNIVLLIVIGGLIYMLVKSVSEPIVFKAEKNKREKAVIDKLMDIRTLQESYRRITGEYAPNFDTLKQVLATGEFRTIKVIGNPDDPTDPNVTYDTLYTPAIDTIQKMGINLDSIRFVPFSGGKTFYVKADTITYQQTLVPVVEVGVEWKEFMGRFSDPRFSRYDNRYDPEEIIKFGDMSSPNISGNW